MKIAAAVVRGVLLTSAALSISGCSAFWPLSEDLEERIRAESEGLSPAIDQDDEVVAFATEAAEGTVPSPEELALPDDVGLDDYVRLAVERHPRIQALIRGIEALGMKVPQVTSLSNPSIAFSPPTGDMVETAAGQIDAKLGVSQSIPFPSKLAARGRVAEEAVRMALEALDSARLQVIADVKRAYYGYYLTNVSIEITRENQGFLQRIRGVADAKFRAGTAPQQDVLRAEVELYELSNNLLTLEQERRTAVALLNVLMDRAVDAELPPPKPFDPRRVEWELEPILARAVERSPELKEIQHKVLRDLESVRLAKLEYLPDFSIGAGYSFIGGGISPVATGADAWDMTLGMTLPIWLQRIRAGILERNAESLSSALKYRSRRNDTFFAIQDALVRVDTQYRSAVLFRDGIIPRARQTVEASESGYQAGGVDFLTWIDNWRRWLDFTLQYHTALASLEQSFARLEELAGGSLPRSQAEEAEPSRDQGAATAAPNEDQPLANKEQEQPQ